MRRVINHIKCHKNWLDYYNRKYFGSKSNEFIFVGRSGLKITVPSRLMQTYKECFFDETYFKGFPSGIKIENLKNVIDIGANVGYFSLSVFSKNPGANVFAFEPIKTNFELLKKYRTENPQLNFKAFNKAVSGKRGKIVLNFDKSDSFTTAATVFDKKLQPDQVEVEAITLRGIVEENDISQVDFLKLDCEGSEYDVLYATPDSIWDKIMVVSVETHVGKKENENKEALVDFFKKKNFQIRVERSQIWAWKK